MSRYVPVQTEDFAEFYEASYRRVVALVAAIVGDRRQAEDIAQEAFSRALTRWQRFHSTGSGPLLSPQRQRACGPAGPDVLIG